MVKEIVKACHKTREHPKIERFVWRHPCLAFQLMFIGVPLFVLLALFAVIYLVVVPLGLLLGWV